MSRFRLLTRNAVMRSVLDDMPNWAPDYSLDRKIADARESMGEERWRELNKEWEQ